MSDSKLSPEKENARRDPGGRFWLLISDSVLRLRPAAADQHSDAEQSQRGGAGLGDGKIETTVGIVCAARAVFAGWKPALTGRDAAGGRA